MDDNLFDWYEPDRDEELRSGFADHSSFALIRQTLERFTRNIAIGGDRYLELPSFDELHRSNPDVDLGMAFAATFDGAEATDTSTAVCGLYWIVAARHAQFACPVIDVVIQAGSRHIIDGLRTATQYAMSDPGRLDPRAGRALLGLSPAQQLRIWMARETPTGRAFGHDEMQLVTADCSVDLRTPLGEQDGEAARRLRGAARVNLFNARKAFWAAFDKTGAK